MSTQLSGETLDGGWMDDIPKFVQPCNWGSTRFRGVVLVLLLSNRIRCAGLLGVMGLLSSLSFAGGPHAVGKVNELSVPTAQKKLNQASARFIENTGQWPNKALFLARSRNVNVWLTKGGVTFDYFDSKVGQKVSDRKGQVVSMSFKGSSPLNPVGVGQLSYKTQYLKGNGKLKHAAGNYSSVVAKNIYPGVNLHSYYDHEKPRYDLVVKPNADPSVIHLGFHGADKTALVGNTIQLSTQIGTLSQGKLYAYQMVTGKKQRISAEFVQLGQDEFGFKLGAYDRTKELVIDPLVYGSYYGGDGGFDSVNAITTDNRGGVYLTGYTLAADFPAIDGPYGFTIHGGKDAFVAKLQGDAYNEDYSAYVGGSLDDNAQFITVDPFGDIWIAGKTLSSDFVGNEVYQHPNIQFLQATTSPPNFPPTGGIFQIQYGNGASTVQLPYNATPLEVQNALNALLGTTGVVVTAQPAGTLLSNGGTYRISLPWNFPLLLSISNNTEPVSYVVTPRVAGQAVELAGAGGTNPTGGTFALDFLLPTGTVVTATLAYNATAAQVQTACNNALGGQYVRVQQETTTNATPFLISFVGLNSPYTNNPPTILVDPASALTGGSFVINSTSRFGVVWDNRTSIPTGGTFDLLVFNPITGAFLGGVQVPYNASAALIQAGLQKAIGTAGTVLTDFEPNPGPSTLPKTTVLVTFTGALANTAVTLQTNSTGITPQPGLGFQPKTGSVFVMRFKQSSSTVLDPVTTETVDFFAAATGIGDEQSVTLSAFSIRPEANPAPTDPIVFAIGGTVGQAVPEISGYSGQQSGYISKYSYSPSINQFTQDATITRYVSGGNSVDLNGLVMDLQGSVYVGGTVHFNGNVDTSVTPVFVTTPGVFANGRLLRNDDLFVQKYINSSDPTKVLAYSALIGGNDYDSAGGFDFDVDGTPYNTGSTVAIDSNLNLYITGISGSFDFPRTRNVYGETFTNNANVVVTKINADASKILYSTNLRTSGAVYPGGISVDPRGDAFITGNVHPNYYLFADSLGNHTLAGNPNQPTKMPLGTINVTGDALVPTNMQPTGGGSDIATSKGFLNVLNPSADTLLYGTYLGGTLDTKVFAPYVDSFGDVWVMGWVDTYRLYDLFSSSGSVTQYEDFGATDGDLPAAMISPLAFKSTSDAFGFTQVNGVLFGALSPYYPNIVPFNWSSTATPPGSPLPTISAVYKMDGWLDKLRVGLASVQSVTFNPTLIPGGLGASTTGTVTLTQAAPNGGADVVLTLLNNTTAASFSGGSSSSTLVVTIPAGSTTGTFTVYSEAVTVNTSVQVQATYQGSFQVGLFTVTPWLQQLSLTPNSVVGGNSVTGRITIAALPPTGSGGVPINILTDTPSLVSFPGGSTVTVPEGQTSVTFTINTNGVAVVSFPQVTASELGVGITQVLTLELASLSTISFNPSSVAGGTASTGTITLNGQASGNLVVKLASSDPSFTFADSNGNAITSVTFLSGDVAKSFMVITPYEPATTSDVITASIPSSPVQGNYKPQSISGTLFVTSADLTAISVNPTSVLGGTSSTGTVTINTPAPTGGVVVNLSTSNPAVAQVPTSVTIPAGATVSAPFTITTNVIANTTQVNIIAQRGLVIRSATLTVQGVNFAVTLSPSSIVGGPSGTVTGTITLTSAAPAAGLSFDLSLPTSQDKYAFFGSSGTATSTATVLGGGITGNFTINTAIVPSLQSIPITVKVHGQAASTGVTTTLQVRVVGVNSITFSPSVIRGRGQQFTFATITLDAPAPAGGTLVVLTQSLPLLHLQAGGYLVPAGFSSLTIKPGISAVGVSRSLADTVSATPPNGGNSAQAVVVVTR